MSVVGGPPPPGPPDALPPGTVRATEQGIEQLLRGRPWAKFLGVLGLVCAGLLGVGALGMAAFAALRTRSVPILLPLVVMAVMVAIMVLWAVLSLGYARHVEAYVAGENESLVIACKNLRILCVFATISFALSVVLGLGAMVIRMIGFGSLVE